MKRPGSLFAAPGALRKVTQHVSISQLPDKSDHSVVLAWLLGVLPGKDHRAAAMALAKILRGQKPLDHGLREVLAEEVNLAARERGLVLKLKSKKQRMDRNRDVFIAAAVWRRLQDTNCTVTAAQNAVASENNLGFETVRTAWKKLQRRFRETEAKGKIKADDLP